MAEENNENVTQAEKPAGGGAISKLLLILAVAAGSAAGSGAAAWLVGQKTQAAILASIGKTDAESETAVETSQTDLVAEQMEKWAVIPLDPFVVNLADKDSSRYLRIKVSLMVDDKHEAPELAENQALQSKLRDVILQSLTRKTSHDLETEEGKNHLRAELKGQLTGYFKKPKLVDVMFTDFVIQL